MDSGIIFEVCAEEIAACLAAREGGAGRIELCSALSEGGLTPSHALARAAIERSGLPVYMLLRPRGGNFVYTTDEFALMERDLDHGRALGASGFVAGCLLADGRVDQPRMRALVERAQGLEVTFHRAFDETNDLEQALEDVIATGCRRLLTSGGAPDVEAGALQLSRLREQAAGRIAIAAGGGLRLENAFRVARTTGLRTYHGSLRSEAADGAKGVEATRAMIQLLRRGFAESVYV